MTHEPPPPATPEPFGSDELWAALALVHEAGLIDGITFEMWKHIPEEVCRDFELDNGRLIRRQSGSQGHQGASLALASAIKEAARKAVSDGVHPCLAVRQDLDTRLWEVPRATIRRPDVLAYRCLEPGADLWAKDVLLAVEIVSPTSQATDTGRDNPESGFQSKMTQYAVAGIPNYWIVRLVPDASAIESIEEWHLVPSVRKYTLVAIWKAGESSVAMETQYPFDINLTWSGVEF